MSYSLPIGSKYIRWPAVTHFPRGAEARWRISTLHHHQPPPPGFVSNCTPPTPPPQAGGASFHGQRVSSCFISRSFKQDGSPRLNAAFLSDEIRAFNRVSSQIALPPTPPASGGGFHGQGVSSCFISRFRQDESPRLNVAFLSV